MSIPSTSSSHGDAQLEQRANDHLSAGRWRKAREDLKPLCKKDRAKFLPLLIEANVGLAREMLAKRLVSEAQQVVAYLKTIAPVEVIRGLELQIAAHSRDLSQFLPGAIALLATAGGSMPAGEKLRWADQVVLAFSLAPSGTPEEAQVAAEARIIHEALEAIGAEQNDRALDIIRPVGRDSAFSHWKLFVKGLAAFHGGDAGKAVRIFESLPAESVPGRARAPYLLLLGQAPPEGRPLAEPVLDAALRLSGHGGHGGWLARAEAFWRARKHRESYKAVREALPSFPSEGLDLSGVLSEFYFTSIFTLDEESRFAYGDFFLPIEISKQNKNSAELKLIRRTFCLLMAGILEPKELLSKWEAFLRGHMESHGYNPRLESLAYGWLGEVFARPRPRSMFDDRRKIRLRAPEDAIAVLKKSIDLDPQNAAAHLQLCAVYESLNRAGERSRLLDAMAKRFPDNKNVLLRAGSGCLDRKAFVKGIEYFERAIVLDRLDPKAPDLLVQGYLRLARQHFQKGRVEDARKALLRADKFTAAAPENFWRNPWCYRVHRGLLEMAWGDAALGRESLAQARAESPFEEAFLWFAELAWHSSAPAQPAVSPFAAELKRSPKSANAARAAVLIRVWQFWENQSGAATAGEKAWLRKYLKSAASHPCAREEAETAIDLLKTDSSFCREALKFTDAALKRDPQDPLFLAYEILLRTLGPYRLESERKNVEAILDEATRRGDSKAVKLARELFAGMNPPPSPFESEWDDDEDDDDEPDFPFAEMLPQEETMMAGVMAMLAEASDKEIKELLKNPPPGMPIEILDTLLAAAREGVSSPVRKSAPKPKAAEADPDQTDPDQLELF